jgi:geranylgeranyl diphosphate synthase type I
MYTLGIRAFISIKINNLRKIKTLQKITDISVHTVCGEFLDLMYEIMPIRRLTKKNIYRLYELKNTCYTFCLPLTAGATLAGARKKDIDLLSSYGMQIGRSYQIRDDVISMFNDTYATGKSVVEDLKNTKKTLLIWYAFQNTSSANKKILCSYLNRENTESINPEVVKKIVFDSGALQFAKREIARMAKKAERILSVIKMKPEYKKHLNIFSRELLLL